MSLIQKVWKALHKSSRSLQKVTQDRNVDCIRVLRITQQDFASRLIFMDFSHLTGRIYKSTKTSRDLIKKFMAVTTIVYTAKLFFFKKITFKKF